ncbi:hypothetical protein [Mucilaginibacter flavus]|uniref:hypothetical protein n=1 Tax=Mucilaginibacter flavus TaxID=931504 RepID=UPI0025B5A882|nr:hypothetical protein [Mucilaginibacter flavus]MDN3584166.1 hypothetical protein [Mucilaginibacter flavus]
MKKILGLAVTFAGILAIAYGFIFTPKHTFNAADSVNGLDASAALVFAGFVTFGIGLVIFMGSLPYAGEKKAQA